MKYPIILLLLATTFAAGHAQAASKSPVEQRYRASYQMCLDSADTTQAMVSCNETERTFQDEKLNQAYQMVMARLPANRKTELRQSERKWVKYRDATCGKELTGDFAGGSMTRVTYSGCLVDETIKRTIYLEHYK